MCRYWYVYKGSGFDPFMASSYVWVPGFPGCTTGSQLCAIYSPGNHSVPQPIANPSNLHYYISDALVGDGNPRPVDGPPYFVYMKPS